MDPEDRHPPARQIRLGTGMFTSYDAHEAGQPAGALQDYGQGQQDMYAAQGISHIQMHQGGDPAHIGMSQSHMNVYPSPYAQRTPAGLYVGGAPAATHAAHGYMPPQYYTTNPGYYYPPQAQQGGILLGAAASGQGSRSLQPPYIVTSLEQQGGHSSESLSPSPPVHHSGQPLSFSAIKMPPKGMRASPGGTDTTSPLENSPSSASGPLSMSGPSTKIINASAVMKPASPSRGGTSRFRGVTFHRRTGRWEAHLWDGGRQMYLGGFDNETKAATAYDFMALRCRGPNADLNFGLEAYKDDLDWLQKVSKEELVLSLRRHSKGFARGSSKYRGVSLNPNGRWEARCSEGGRKYSYLGLFDTEEEAAIAYDRVCVRRNGLNAVTNFGLSRYTNELKEHMAAKATMDEVQKTSKSKASKGKKSAESGKEDVKEEESAGDSEAKDEKLREFDAEAEAAIAAATERERVFEERISRKTEAAAAADASLKEAVERRRAGLSAVKPSHAKENTKLSKRPAVDSVVTNANMDLEAALSARVSQRDMMMIDGEESNAAALKKKGALSQYYNINVETHLPPTCEPLTPSPAEASFHYSIDDGPTNSGKSFGSWNMSGAPFSTGGFASYNRRGVSGVMAEVSPRNLPPLSRLQHPAQHPHARHAHHSPQHMHGQNPHDSPLSPHHSQLYEIPDDQPVAAAPVSDAGNHVEHHFAEYSP